jgi:fatty-acyl-CoA synthase
VKKGDRVLLYLQNCPQWAVAFHAVQRADAVVVPVNPMNRADEFGHYITDPEARVAITSADLAATVQQANRACRRAAPATRCWSRAWPTRCRRRTRSTPSAIARSSTGCAPTRRCRRCQRWADALAAGLQPGPCAPARRPGVLPYTSGTTGLPKGCMHTHRTLMPNVVGGGLWGQSGAETVALGVVPMFHITGLMYNVLATAYLAGRPRG